MEFCPEVAVLQSAFHLLEQKVGGKLADLPKHSCEEFTPIICTAVAEICTGLEQDNDAENELLWKQRVHQLILYTLIKRKYTKKQDVPKDCVPVLCTLDSLTGVIPTFSCHFYFELVKLCSWQQLFVDSLAHLRPDTAELLLKDAVYHYMHDLETETDISVVVILLENLLSQICSCPANTDELLQGLNSSLYSQKAYIRTVFPAETDDPVDEPSRTVGEELGVGNGTDTGTQQNCKFWCMFLENNPSFMSQVLDLFVKKYVNNNSETVPVKLSSQPETVPVKPDSQPETVPIKPDSQRLIRGLAQLLFLWYSVHVTENDAAVNGWFIYNVYSTVTEVEKQPRAVCTLNYLVTDCIERQLSAVDLLSGIHSCLLIVKQMAQGKTESATTSVECSNDIEIVSKIKIKLSNLLRVFNGTIPNVSHKATTECQNIVQWFLNRDVSVTSHASRTAATDVSDVLYGDSWERDITLAALLWRIECKQPQAEACLEELLSEKCLQFWFSNRLYRVLDRAESQLFSTKRILKLLKIAVCIKTDAQREINQNIQRLILTKFSELSFLDQDYVIMMNYTQMTDDVFVADQDFAVNTTNVFNKLTAISDDQVVKEMVQLCLIDPVSIVRGAVELCVRNEDQAVSSAKVLQLLCSTCRCLHTQHHPDMTLIGTVLHQFVTSVSLNKKEEQMFLVFIRILMQSDKAGTNHSAVLSPLEFLQTTLIPHTSIGNFVLDDAPIKHRFALSLLFASLTAACNSRCDWSKVDLEPVTLVVILAQILHECVVLWDCRQDQETVEVSDMDPAVGPQFSLSEKAAMRDSASMCLDIMYDIVQKGYITPEDWHIEWLVKEMSCLHWSVQYRLLKLLAICGHSELAEEWDRALAAELSQMNKQLTSVLMLAGIGGVKLDRSSTDVRLDNSSVISSLAQVWPNMLPNEFENVLTFLGQLLLDGCITLTRGTSRPSFEVLELKFTADNGKVLGISKLLHDVILTLTLSNCSNSTSQLYMLTHIVQMYVSALKAQCETISGPLELRLYVLCQLFLHVSTVTELLPSPVSEQTWVLLLSIVSHFMAECTDSIGVEAEKMVARWTQCMLVSIQRLPGCEERTMIVKKLNF